MAPPRGRSPATPPSDESLLSRSACRSAAGARPRPRSIAAPGQVAEAERHRHVADSGEPETGARPGSRERRRPGPDDVGCELGAPQPGERPPVLGAIAAIRDEVRGGEGEPDRAAPPEELAGVVRGLVVA